MGGTLDVEGGRKTRSSTRGSAPATPATPPPAKKARTTTPRRGRPKKNDSHEAVSLSLHIYFPQFQCSLLLGRTNNTN